MIQPFIPLVLDGVALGYTLDGEDVDEEGKHDGCRNTVLSSVAVIPPLELRAEQCEALVLELRFYVREAILRHLEHMEDRYLAIDRLENPARRWSLAEAERDLDLDG